MAKTGRIRIPFSALRIRWVLYTPDRSGSEVVLPSQPNGAVTITSVGPMKYRKWLGERDWTRIHEAPPSGLRHLAELARSFLTGSSVRY